jgi:hypothetical protein
MLDLYHRDRFWVRTMEARGAQNEYVCAGEFQRQPILSSADFSSSYLLDASFLSYSSTLKMEVTYCSETLVNFQRTTHRYIPDDAS